ncbi:universal stress protein [Kitasatospora griseola]|uniref:universal stress protein n=1 Tax=Kitasatospora griseola TaxID=2064 RepID=UPI00166FABB2|nr:universal stress protein [Kitasatospora griseola]GGQ88247.1 universal stress protein [Kitasatospora griseola]
MTSPTEPRPIVLGVDARQVSPMVVGWAAAEAERRGLPLRLVQAVPDEPRDLHGDGRSFLQSLRDAGSVALEKAEGIALERHPRLPVQSVLREGSPAPLLCEESEGAALVVLGSRRLGRLEEKLSRYSVTVPVSAQAHCPVAVVREPEHTTLRPPYVVVGVDGSPWCAAAVRFAADLAARRGAALRAVRVRRTPVRPFEPLESESEIRRRLFEATAGCAADEPDLDLTHEVIGGHPVDELVRVSAHALAVVVGRHGHGGLTGLRLGSVPHGLIRQALCPVVTVPAGPGADDPLTREQ